MKCIKEEDSIVLVENALIRERWQSYFHKILNDERDKVLLWETWRYLRRVVIIIIVGV